jgi:sugar phosphate isomerase/epimerase
MEKDFKGTLQQVKAMGYDGVEFAGLFNNSPAQVKAWCEEIGLNPISAHVPLADMLADIDKVIADYKAVGCKYIVVPYVTEERRPGGELFMQMVEEIRAIGEKCKAAGLVLLYHNHDFEFKKLESGEFGLDYLYANVPADLLQTELDQCWVKYSGQDPVAYLQKYSGRSPVVHLKDFYQEGEQEGDPYALIGLNEGEEKKNTAFEFRPLGHGVQDVPSIIAASEAADSKWLIVEQDQPSMGKTPMECVAMSMEYLKSIYGKTACKDCQEAAK